MKPTSSINLSAVYVNVNISGFHCQAIKNKKGILLIQKR